MVFVSGIAGQLFRDQALTVTFAQLISLMVGITLVPMLTAWRARLGEAQQEVVVDAGEPRETLGALRRYLRAALGNLGVNALVRPRARITAAAGRVPAFIVWIPHSLRWVLRLIAWLVRYLITFVVRVSRVFLGLLGKLLAVLLSPFVWVTQKSYGVLDRHYPVAARLGAGASRRSAVHGVRPARRHGRSSCPGSAPS